MKIRINIRRKEIVSDVLANCNLIARSLAKKPETEELAGEIMTPDDEQTKPIVARALTEAFGEVKRTCQEYLIYGRLTDDNRLERIDETNRHEETVEAAPQGTACHYHLLTGILYRITATASKELRLADDEGNTLARGTDISLDYTPVRTDEYLTVACSETTSATVTYRWGDFGRYEVRLDMPPRFNIGMTETVKNCIHRLMTDYVMQAVLRDQYPDKAAEYATRFDSDRKALRDALLSRTRYRRPYAGDWS